MSQDSPKQIHSHSLASLVGAGVDGLGAIRACHRDGGASCFLRSTQLALDAMFTCCIGMSGGSTNDGSSYQYKQSFQLVPTSITAGDASSPVQRSDTTHVDVAISMTAPALEEAISSCLTTQDVTAGDADGGEFGEYDVDDFDDFDPVEYFDSEDAHLLRCRMLTSCGGQEGPTIFGISESATSFGNLDREGGGTDGCSPVSVSLFEPIGDFVLSGSNHHERKHPTADCCCRHPRGRWERCRTTRSAQRVASTCTANVSILDLTRIQNLRRGIKSNHPYPCFDTPGRVFHLLRSVLKCNRSMNHHSGALHSASPWYQNVSYAADQNVVAFLLNNPGQTQGKNIRHDEDRFWDDVEEREIDELLQFRTGDAAPSYFLHSTSQLSGDLIGRLCDSLPSNRIPNRAEMFEGYCSSRKTILFVYRRLPPRDVLSHIRLGEEKIHVGCMWEKYLEDAKDTDPDAGLESPAETLSVVKHRMVSPPYLSHELEYPSLLDSLLAGLDSLRREARKIPQWTAWPEQNHYADNSWNVFPLCYTFPANDVTKRKFIQKTCAFVPATTKLLQTLGPVLRTALFSRLDPRARLGAHTGWSDLANHVLRVHVPLIVPGSKRSDGETRRNGDNYSMGLCGTWVDGCVETHEEGSIICFDDSKVHRAFNYSEEERIVLIIDLARPQDLPLGTATGGHSDDLDAFISGY